MSTPMFQEALIEAKKLRDVAAIEAKNAVLEAVSPLIKQMIDQEISGIIVEQDEMTPPAAAAPPSPDAPPPAPPTPSPDAGSTGPIDAAAGGGTDMAATSTMPTMKPAVAAAAPPIVSPGTPVTGKIDISPTGEQQIVISVDSLFQKETSPAETGATAVPTELPSTPAPEVTPPAGPETAGGAPPASPAELETPPAPETASPQLAEIYRAVQKLLREQATPPAAAPAAPPVDPNAAAAGAVPPAAPAVPPAAPPADPNAAAAAGAVPPAAPPADPNTLNAIAGAPPAAPPAVPGAAAAVPPAAPAPQADPMAAPPVEPAPVAAAPVAAAQPAAPAAPVQMEYKAFKDQLELVESNVQTLRKGNVNSFLKEAHEKQLFGLYQSLINLKNKNAISSRLFSFNEDRLGLLYENLNVITSYKRNPLEKGKNMKNSSLKELVRTLFEGAEGFEDPAGKVSLPAQSEGGDSKHAHKVSGNPKGVKAEAEDAPFPTKEKEEWPGKPSPESLLEQLEEEIAEMMGDMGDDGDEGYQENMDEDVADETMLELDNDEIVMEARKAKARLKALREQAEDNLSLTIDLGGVSSSDVDNVNVSLDGEELDVDMGSEEDMGGEEDMGEEDMEMSSDEDMEMPEEEGEEEESLQEARKLVRKAKNSVNENKVLREQLSETQLLTARSLYVNKLFVRDDLSGAQKRKIVEYLDSARTLAEAKEIYNRVVRVLNTAKKNGMMNESVTSDRKVLSESAGYVEPSFDTTRWQVLAGVKRTAK
jgi:hypothetical protein